jgi:methyl-accepting chemotaxis protein
MNLTVAMRVIGGFAVTATLLLFLGVNSVTLISGIAESTGKVNQVSVPALGYSSVLQQKFVEMSKTTLIDYYATDFDTVDRTYSQFNDQANEFRTELDNLSNLVSEEPVLAQALPLVEDSYSTFMTTATDLFKSKKRTLQLADQVNESFDETELAADDASSYALDFLDMNELRDVNPDAADAVSKVESNMLSVISALTDLKKESKADTISIIIKELSYSQKSFTDQLDIIKQYPGLRDMEGYGELVEQIELVNQWLTSDKSVATLKQEWVSQVAKTDRLLNQTNDQIASGVKAVDSLVETVNSELNVMKEAVDNDVSSGITNSSIVIIVSLVLSIFIAFQTVIRVTRPLAEVNRILNVVATGDLTTKLDDSAKDEFGTLAKNCNRLIDSLRDLINGIVHRSNQLATASEQTSMIVRESTIAINDQRSQVEQAATATTEMSSTSQSVMERANEALEDIKHADEEAERVKQISNVNRETIIKLAGEIDQAAGVINEVNQHSAAIGGILDVIRGVAEQTNLLALNAAIEAARAGEQGRGFAVVADEVRSLASKTQQSTEEIQAMIEQLQRGSKSAVSVMNNSKSQAELCVTQTEQASEALEAITDSVHQANDMSEQIVTAAQEQNQVSSEISERLEQIVAIAEQTAAGSSQTELSAQEVAKLAEELRQSVDQFKL